MRKVLALGALALACHGLWGCGGPTELSNEDVAAKKAELNKGAPPEVASPDQGDRGH